MRRATIVLALLGGVLAGCGTPQVAEEYEVKVYLPQELEEALRSEDPTRRADAANQMETMPPARRREVLVSLVCDERPHVRLMAVSLLGKHHADDAETVKTLGGVLSLDTDLDVRSAAVGALASSRNPKAIAILVGVLTDDASLVVKREAAEALDGCTGQAFGKTLVGSVDTAEAAADEAMMSYEEWFEGHRATLRWNEKRGCFVGSDG